MDTSNGAGDQVDPLPGLRQQLTEEYGDTVPRERIDEVAQQALGEFGSARVRDFVPVLAWRRARHQLRFRIPS
jgi:hypothetical protein